jgi:ectoine hydroxylase-related dioxygenase (phytanoyl-CoA dioxygenase family)
VSPEHDGGAFDLSDWLEDIERIDRAGDVFVRLSSGRRSVTLQLSAPGARRQVLARTRFGDVSYNQVAGLSEGAAADLTRAYAERLDGSESSLPARLPHLAIAAGEGRAPGSCRPALAPLWASELALPEAREVLSLDPAGLADFLAPELRAGGSAFAGFVLHSIQVQASDDGRAECVLELAPAAGTPVPEPVLVAVRAQWRDEESFGSPQAVSLAVRRGGTDRQGDLLPEVARLCSLLMALVELKQSTAFTLRVPDLMPATVSSSSREPTRGAGGSPASELDIHRFSILSSGYTILRDVLPADEIGEIAAGVERALAAMHAAAEAGREIAYTFYDKDTYLGTRCIYCWGDACLRLIENDWVRRIADSVIGPHKLFDMSAHRALPAAHLGPEQTEEWHRDIDVFDDTPPGVRYLWFFLPLDDFTPENGATWVVPGSQRMPNLAVPPKGSVKQFPTRVQLTGRVGDVFVVNPSALHTVGHNSTPNARTMINLGVCHASIRPLLDHWAIAGPAIQASAGERLRGMLGAAGEPPLDTTWSVLPEGWQTSRRTVESDPSARVFPAEQQGYQRSHRVRDGE